MKEGDKGINLSSIIISKARGVPKSLFCAGTALEREDMSVVLDKQFVVVFILWSHLCPGCRKGLEDKTYPAIDLPINGESDGVSCILVEDCI